MSAAERVVGQERAVGEKPATARSGRRRTVFIVLGAVIAGALLFAAGIGFAGRFGDDAKTADAVDQTTDAIVLTRLTTLTQQADAIIARAQQTEPADVAGLQDLGVELQVVAVALGDLPAQAATDELRDVTQQVADAYLQLSIGMVTNNGAQTSEGAAALTDSRDALATYLGVEQDPDPVEEPAEGATQ